MTSSNSTRKTPNSESVAILLKNYVLAEQSEKGADPKKIQDRMDAALLQMRQKKGKNFSPRDKNMFLSVYVSCKLDPPSFLLIGPGETPTNKEPDNVQAVEPVPSKAIDTPAAVSPFKKYFPVESQPSPEEKKADGIIMANVCSLHALFRSTPLGDRHPFFEVHNVFGKPALMVAIGPGVASDDSTDAYRGRHLRVGAQVNFESLRGDSPCIVQLKTSKQRAFEYDKLNRSGAYCLQSEKDEPIYLRMYVSDPSGPSGKSNLEDLCTYHVFLHGVLHEISKQVYFRAKNHYESYDKAILPIAI